MNLQVTQKGQEDSLYVKNFENIGTLWPSNIELYYTEAIRKHCFRITLGDIDTVQEKDIHTVKIFFLARY